MQVSCLSAFQLPWHCLVAPHVSQEASGFQYLSASLQDLIRRMLTLDPAERITTDAIAPHPWLAHAEIPPPAVTVGADGTEAAARDWSTFWPDAESLTASAGAAGAGVGLPTIGSLGSDESYDMGAYHARLSRELQHVIRAGLAGFLLALSVAGAALGLHVFSRLPCAGGLAEILRIGSYGPTSCDGLVGLRQRRLATAVVTWQYCRNGRKRLTPSSGAVWSTLVSNARRVRIVVRATCVCPCIRILLQTNSGGV